MSGWSLLRNLLEEWAPREWTVLLWSDVSAFKRQWNTPKSRAIIVYDGGPECYNRPPDCGTMHFDAAFSPWSCFTAANNRSARWIVVDPMEFGETATHLDLARILHPACCTVSDFVSLRSAVHALAEEPANEATISLDLARRCLVNRILSPGDHHHVANLVGPLVLARDLPDADALIALIGQGKPAVLAFDLLLQRLDLNPTAACSIPIDFSESDPLGRKVTARVLLVDDQYHLGFDKVLASALGLSTERTTFMASPKKVLDGLGAERIDDWRSPRRFEACDVLFLDLRLWTDDGGRDAVLKAIADKGEALGWRAAPAVYQAAFDACELAAKGKEFSEAAAIAALPLLVSAWDPSLPIVIFSSAQRRETAHLLMCAPNIVSTFAKPLVDGRVRALDEEPIRLLHEAWTRALVLHEARAAWDRLCRIGNLVKQGSAKIEVSALMAKSSAGKQTKEFCAVIDLRWVNEIADDYVEYMLHNRFGDALLTPGNWIEAVFGGSATLDARPDGNAMALALTLAATGGGNGTFGTRVLQTAKVLRISASSRSEERTLVEGLALLAGMEKADPAWGSWALMPIYGWYKLVQPRRGGWHRLMPWRFRDNSRPPDDAKLEDLLVALPDAKAAMLGAAHYANILPLAHARNARAHRSIGPRDAKESQHFSLLVWLWFLAWVESSLKSPHAPGPLEFAIDLGHVWDMFRFLKGPDVALGTSGVCRDQGSLLNEMEEGAGYQLANCDPEIQRLVDWLTVSAQLEDGITEPMKTISGSVARHEPAVEVVTKEGADEASPPGQATVVSADARGMRTPAGSAPEPPGTVRPAAEVARHTPPRSPPRADRALLDVRFPQELWNEASKMQVTEVAGISPAASDPMRYTLTFRFDDARVRSRAITAIRALMGPGVRCSER